MEGQTLSVNTRSFVVSFFSAVKSLFLRVPFLFSLCLLLIFCFFSFIDFIFYFLSKDSVLYVSVLSIPCSTSSRNLCKFWLSFCFLFWRILCLMILIRSMVFGFDHVRWMVYPLDLALPIMGLFYFYLFLLVSWHYLAE